MDNTLNQHNS